MKLKTIEGASLYELEQLANQFFKEHPLIKLVDVQYSAKNTINSTRGSLWNRDLLIFYEESSASNN